MNLKININGAAIIFQLRRAFGDRYELTMRGPNGYEHYTIEEVIDNTHALVNHHGPSTMHIDQLAAELATLDFVRLSLNDEIIATAN